MKQLPDGWRWVRLGDQVAKVGSGFTPLGGHATYRSSGVPLIRSQNVHMNRFVSDGLVFISGEQDEEMTASRVQIGDVLLNITGASIGRVCVAPSEICPANVNQHVCVIRGDGSLDPEFLAFYLSTPDFQKFILDSQAGATRQALTKAMIEGFRIPFAELSEQRRIAGVLRERMAAVDAARRSAEAQLEAAQALPAAYLRVIFDSAEAKAWPRKRLGGICEITARQVDPKMPEFGALPHVNGENIESGLCRLKYLNTAAEEGMISGKYLFEQGDVLYSKLRPYLRKALVAECRGVCSADMYPIHVNCELLDPHFTGWLLVSDEFTAYADEESRRARMPKLNREQLFAWDAPIPPLADQHRIAAELAKQMAGVERLRRGLEEQLAAIRALPAALLRRAFSGEL